LVGVLDLTALNFGSPAVAALIDVGAGVSVPNAVVYGIACAAANALTLTSGEVRTADVHTLLSQVRLTRLA
jgi:hypothetical protein